MPAVWHPIVTAHAKLVRLDPRHQRPQCPAVTSRVMRLSAGIGHPVRRVSRGLRGAKEWTGIFATSLTASSRPERWRCPVSVVPSARSQQQICGHVPQPTTDVGRLDIKCQLPFNQRIVDALEALGDPARRRIVEILAEGELSAGEIAARSSSSRPATSRQLRLLREAGALTVQTQGTRRIYAVNRDCLAEVDRWLRQRLDALDTELRRVRHERSAGRG
jgi:DNA-binding transcriptional ArsR family regulator